MVEGEGVEIRDTAEGAGTRVRRPDDYAPDPGVDDRARAHGTRLERYVEGGLRQAPAAKLPARAVDREQLRVVERVLPRFLFIMAAADDPLAAIDDHGADGDLVHLAGDPGLRERLAHISLVLPGHSSLFPTAAASAITR